MSHDYLVESEDYKGFTINVYFDNDSESPRTWDNLGIIYTNHRRCNPDGHTMSELTDYADEYDGDVEKYLDAEFIWLPIGYYEHSGITLWVGHGSGWDSGNFGVIAVRKEKVAEEYGDLSEESIERAKKCLEGEIKTLDQFCTGEVYGFITVDENGDEQDSCWGYYDKEYLYEDAKGTIDVFVEKREAERAREAMFEHILSVCGLD